MNFILLLFAFAAQLFFTPLNAQSATANTGSWVTKYSKDTGITEWSWVHEIQSSRPNYFRAKALFDAYWGDSIPKRGGGYKAFRRWEYRVINRLDDSGYVKWDAGNIDEFLVKWGDGSTSSASSGMNSNSVGSGSPNGGNAVSGGTPNGGSPVQPVVNCGSQGRWEAVGPAQHPWNQSSQPTGVGRINGIAFHPTDTNTIFALAPQGGVWKSTNYGKTWMHFWSAPNSSGFLTLGASAMVLSHKNSDTLYIGTGDCDAGDAPGYGVIYSTNGGKTFALRNTGMGNVTVGRIIMHPKNSGYLLAATSGGVFRSLNSGNTWARTSPAATKYHDLVFHPSNPNIVYAASNGYFFRSTDGGASFVQITNGLPTTGMQRAQIAVTAADRNRVYFLVAAGSKFYGLYVSQDSGLLFANANTKPANILGYSELGTDGSGQGWYDLDIAADPKDSNKVFVFGVNVWKSVNGGADFTVSGHWVGAIGDDIHADQHIGEFNGTGKTLFVGNDGGIYFSGDGGKKYVNISSGIQNSQIYRLDVSQNQPFMSAQGYQDNGSAQQNRSEFYTYYGGDGMDCAVDQGNDQYVYGSYVYGDIYRAIDKTNITGIVNTSKVNEGAGWLTPFILQEGNPNRMFVGYNNIWKCDSVKTTGTITFTKISSGFPGTVQSIKNCGANNKILYVIRGDGKLYRGDGVHTNTPTWTDLTPNLPVGISLRAIEASGKDSNVLYIAGTNTLYKSSNKGASFTQVGIFGNGVATGISYGNITCLKFDTSGKYEELYIGTDRGVYNYRNDGTKVTGVINDYFEDFPLWADVTDLAIFHYKGNRKRSYLYASTYGRGVWRSALHNYSDVSSTVPSPNIIAFDSVFTVGGNLDLYQQVEGPWNGLKWKVTPYQGYSWVNGDSVSSRVSLSFTGTGIYTVTLSTTGCVASKQVLKKHWIKVFAASPKPSCISSTTYRTSNYGIGLLKVMMTDNFKETGTYFDDGEAPDFSADKVFRIKPNTTYSVKVKTGLYNSENAALFVDWNGDGKFQKHKGEMYGSIANNPNIYGVISVKSPAVVKANAGIRMRVMDDYNALDSNACKVLGYGQAEDYSLVYEKTVPNFVANKTKACTGEKVVFRDTSVGLVAQWDWDFGDGANPQYVSGVGPHVVTYSKPGVKRIRLRVNGLDSVVMNALTIIQTPNAYVVNKLGSNALCEQLKVTLAVRDQYASAFSSAWYKVAVPVSWGKGLDSTLVFNPIGLGDSGSYFAVIDNQGCKDTSPIYQQTVYPKPVVVIGSNFSEACLKGNGFVFDDKTVLGVGSVLKSRLWRLPQVPYSDNAKQLMWTFTSAKKYDVVLKMVLATGCEDSSKMQVTVHPQGELAMVVNDSIQCDKGNQFKVTNNSKILTGSLNYQWSWGDATGDNGITPKPKTYAVYGKYGLVLTSLSDKGCRDTLVKQLRVSQTLAPQLQLLQLNGAAASEICENQSVLLKSSAVLGDEGPWILRYYRSDQKQYFNGQLGDTVMPATAYYGNHFYRAYLVNLSRNCKDSNTVNYINYSIPKAASKASPNPLCANMELLNTQNSTTNADGLQPNYTWTLDGNLIASSKNLVGLSFSMPGKHVLHLIASNHGCADSSVFDTIEVLPQVKANYSWKTQPEFGERVEFAALDTVIAGYQYRWSFGDSSFSNSKSGIKYFRYNDSFLVKLSVKNSIGCADSSIFWYKLLSPNYKEQNNVLHFYVYPNPSTGLLHYKFRVNAGDKVSIKITTVLGQQRLYFQEWEALDAFDQFHSIDLDQLHLSAGAYPMEIRRGKDVLNTKIIYIPD